MPFSRRHFLHTSAQVAGVAAGAALLPRPLLARIGSTPEPVPPIQDPRLKSLAQRALDAATAAGATYADVRLTMTKRRSLSQNKIQSGEEGMHAGVRVLYNGYWGFAASPLWSPDELTRLGREATRQAKAGALGKSREAPLAPLARIAEGHWDMPVKIDPFTVQPLEIVDHLRGLSEYVQEKGRGAHMQIDPNIYVHFVVCEKAFASTDGSYCTQRIYRTGGVGQFARMIELCDGGNPLTPAGIGWEMFQDQPFREKAVQCIDILKQRPPLPIKPVDVGRYTLLFDAGSVAQLLSRTIGAATEVDRALGYEANAGGTSYLWDPVEMLGSFRVGAPGLTVTANRSEPGGLATTHWDDDGVEPDEFALVQDGVIADFQTSRDGAGWIQDAYTRLQRPFRSHGCAYADTGVNAPLIRTANLVLHPDPSGGSVHDLEASIEHGLSMRVGHCDVDFQCAGGLCADGTTYEIKNGKRVAVLQGAGVLFRTPELWKSIVQWGGPLSAHRYGTEFVRIDDLKGEPPQGGFHSVTAVPLLMKEMTVIDSTLR